MNFGLLPPEANLGRMYAGAGPGPMRAAGSESAAAEPAAGWQGPSPEPMAAAALHGYAASSATTTRLTPFAQPPRTANPAGPSGAVSSNPQTRLSKLISAP